MSAATRPSSFTDPNGMSACSGSWRLVSWIAIPGPPFWLYYIRVDDVGAAVERVKSLGGQVLNGPMQVPGGDVVAQCCDPQGGAFALHATA